MVAKVSPILPSAEAPSDEIDDYMSMAIVEPTKPLEKETYTQRRIRKQREAEVRSHPKSKAELAAAADAARDEALSTALPATSKGFQMMAKLGFKPGTALGPSSPSSFSPPNANAHMEPLGIAVKEDRGGIGMESEKKRKFREEAAKVEGIEKRRKAEEGDYRERVARERQEQRVEGQCWGAMRVLEGLEQPDEGAKKVPRKSVNVLWRGLVRDREEKEKEKRARYVWDQGLMRNQHYEDLGVDDDEQDGRVWGKEEGEGEEESEDEELDEFLALEGNQRLSRLVEHLRAKHFYCLWCKSKYEDEDIDGCPGPEEDDHD